jgi:phospholipid-binding lipoprotein MlaA
MPAPRTSPMFIAAIVALAAAMLFSLAAHADQIDTTASTAQTSQVVDRLGNPVVDQDGKPLLAPRAVEPGKKFVDDDPFEGLNRGIFAVNHGLDTYVIRPVAIGYNYALPGGVRDSVSNFLSNLNQPVIFVNSLLQGRVTDASQVFGRFLTNTVLGVGGLFDPASDFGVHKVQADFGQTLATYGAGDGPYLVLPVFGPSNVRDAAGLGADFVLDPWRYFYADNNKRLLEISRGATEAVDFRARRMKLIDDTYATSVDPYATFKSFYQQRRAHELGQTPPDGAANDWDQFQRDGQE